MLKSTSTGGNGGAARAPHRRGSAPRPVLPRPRFRVPTRSRSSSRNRCRCSCSRSSSGSSWQASSPPAPSSTRRRSQIDSECRAARCARPSGRSRSRVSCDSRRTAACSSAGSRSRKPTTSTSSAPCWTNSSAAVSRRPSRPRACATAQPRRADGASRGARAMSQPIWRPTSSFTTGWSSSPATPSCSSPTAGSSTSCDLFRHATLAQGGVLPVSSREHRDIVDKIAAGQPAAAGRALYDHVMASRERMHRARSTVVVAPAPITEEVPLSPAVDHRQRAHVPLAARPVVSRLCRWLRARVHQPGDRHRPRAVPRRAARDGHVSHRRLRRAVVHQPEQPVDRHRRDRRPCTASAATISGTATPGAEVMMNDPKYLRAGTILAALADAGRQGRRRHRQGQAAGAARPPDGGHLLLVGEGRRGDDGRERHRRRAGNGRNAGPVGLQRGALRIRVRRRRQAPRAEATRRHVPVDDRLRPAQGGARRRRRQRVLRDDGSVSRRGWTHWARRSW